MCRSEPRAPPSSRPRWPPGVFYDDRSNTSLGSADYALIKDFTANVDKLQVRAGTAYLTTPSTSGKNQDELIAVLQGVTALGSADLIGV